MKSFYEFLTEDSIENEYNRFKTKLSLEEFSLVAKTDPTTKNEIVGKYTKWLVKNYLRLSETDKKRFPEDSYKYTNKLQTYHNLKQYNKLKPEDKDINRFSFSDFSKMIDTYEQEEDIRSKSEIKKDLKSQYKLVFDVYTRYGDNWYVYQPFTIESACHLGQNTDWCTAVTDLRWNKFEDYSDDLYIISKDYSDDDDEFYTNEYRWQLHSRTEQFMNKWDREALTDISEFPGELIDFIVKDWEEKNGEDSFPIPKEALKNEGYYTKKIPIEELVLDFTPLKLFVLEIDELDDIIYPPDMGEIDYEDDDLKFKIEDLKKRIIYELENNDVGNRFDIEEENGVWYLSTEEHIRDSVDDYGNYLFDKPVLSDHIWGELRDALKFLYDEGIYYTVDYTDYLDIKEL